VLDFYCTRARLDIEIDGWVHESTQRAERDGQRSAFLRSQGIATTRIPAKRVLEDLDAVITRLVVICDERIDKVMMPLHQPAAGPPPRSGEES